MKQIFEGTAVAIVTPLKNNKIDYEAFENIIERDIQMGAKAIVVLGTTGEGATMSDYERSEVISFAKSVINGRVKLIAGTGSNNFEQAYYNTKMAKLIGVDAALIVTPYYNKTTQCGLVEYYKRLGGIGLPIIMYNVPSRTGLNIYIDTIEELLAEDMIYGIKESTNDINRIIKLSAICKDRIALYSGEDSLNYIFYVLGAQGAISVTANVYADKVQAVYDYVKNGEYENALRLQNELSVINDLLFVETNPIPVKELMAKKGLIKNELRLPLVNASEESLKRINGYFEDEKGFNI